MPLNHAKHNYEVCLHLYNNTHYNDWIVTTAYYAAIYFMYSKLFPGRFEDPTTGQIKHFSTFKHYCKALASPFDKHKATESLVEENYPEIYSEFKTLKDNCWTARYDDYKVHDEIVNRCIAGINAIAQFCAEN